MSETTDAGATLERVRTYHADLTAIRRDIHAHPELGLETHRTADIVARLLQSWGIEAHRLVNGAGVVGVLRSGNGPRSIGLRADMDALPINERTGAAYRSTAANVMHACGHDGHTTMLLGAARYLAETRRFNGTVNFIFQPGEEGMGGAQAMLEEGLLDRFPADELYGLHNHPGMAVGRFGITPGTAMAGGGFFDIVVKGRGAHGARPQVAVDPVAGDDLVGVGDEAVECGLVPHHVGAFHGARKAVARHRSRLAAHDVVEARAEAVVALPHRVAGAAGIVERKLALLRLRWFSLRQRPSGRCAQGNEPGNRDRA
jgi:amidohydrolase